MTNVNKKMDCPGSSWTWLIYSSYYYLFLFDISLGLEKEILEFFQI